MKLSPHFAVPNFSPAIPFAGRHHFPRISQTPDEIIDFYRRQGFKVRPGKGSHVNIFGPGLSRPLTLATNARQVALNTITRHARILGISTGALRKAIDHNTPLPKRLSVLA
jgi:hypothetical protein